MAVYALTYSIVLYAPYQIEADSDDDAIEKAYRLADNSDFWNNHIVPDLKNSDQFGDALADMRIELGNWCEADDKPTFTTEQINEWIGQ